MNNINTNNLKRGRNNQIQEIMPQGKRKHKIILKAVFKSDKSENTEVEKVLSNVMGKIWGFE